MAQGEDDDRQRRMSDLEAVMWGLEADPFLSSTFANLTFLDRSPDVELLRNRMWAATREVPRLRRRVAPSLGPMTPRWEEDPAFDLDRHLLRVQLPSGTTDAEMGQIATRLVLEPFDPERPLWEFTVFDGLAGGRSAMVQKMHHTITDGKGGIRLSLAFVDLERNAARRDDPPPAPGIAPGSSPFHSVEVIGDALAGVARRNVDSARRLVEGASDLARHPDRLATMLAALPTESVAAAQSLVRQVGVTDSMRSPLWRERTLERSLEVFEVPFQAVRDTATSLGVSVNDLFVAAAAGGAGAYHRARGTDVDELRMAMPMSTRTDHGVGGNAFAITRTLLPVGPDPRARLTAIHDRLAVTKSERLTVGDGLAKLGRLLPRPAMTMVARQQAMTIDFTTSNVRAAPFDLYLAGALMEANYPLGPLAGTAWNLTTMSYRGNLDLGLHVDAGAVQDPSDLAHHIRDAFTELVALGPGRRRRRAPKS